MTVRAPKRRDQVAVVGAQPVFGRRLLRQSARFAIIGFVRLTYRRYCDRAMAEVCARPHPEDVSEACSATLLVPRSCSASTGEIVALNDHACPNNGGLMSIAQEATGSLRAC
jgi:hypothetical protein